MAHHLLKDITGQEGVLDIRHLYVHGDAIITRPLLLGEMGSVREALPVPGASRV